jgi:hypothetical protein
MGLRIELYSRKRAFRRRQYHARIVNEENGNVIWRMSEGYNNRGDRDMQIANLIDIGMKGDIHVVNLD